MHRLVRLEAGNWDRWRPALLSLARDHHSGRITPEALKWLQGLRGVDLNHQGNLVVLLLSGRRLAGTLACSDHGRDQSLIVIHRGFRGKGLSRHLISAAMKCLNEFHARIASDNLPSLKLFFSAGLVAYDVFVRANGKIILKLKTP